MPSWSHFDRARDGLGKLLVAIFPLASCQGALVPSWPALNELLNGLAGSELMRAHFELDRVTDLKIKCKQTGNRSGNMRGPIE